LIRRSSEESSAVLGNKIRCAHLSFCATVSLPIPSVAPLARLIDLLGIGPWTANYIAMRALRRPDDFPKKDVVVRNNLGGLTAKQAEEMSQAWGRGAATRFFTSGEASCHRYGRNSLRQRIATDSK
jgi:hypothetical protein